MKKLGHEKVYITLIIVFLLGFFGYALGSHWQMESRRERIHASKTLSVRENSYGTPGTAAAADHSENGAEIKTGNNTPDTPTAALPNNKRGWGLKRSNGHGQPEMPSSISNTLNKYGAYWIGSPREKFVYLTFDEGYENGYTPVILDTLKSNGVKAAFFVTGHYLKSQPELVKRMVDEGHIVGNHTNTHPSLPDVSDGQIKKELQAVEKMYEDITGRKNMKYLRPPKGEYSQRTLALTRELGYHNIFWSLAMVDWVPMPGGPEQAYRGVMDNLHNGALILLHAVSKDNSIALDRIIKDTKAQGYTFKTLDDLAKERESGS